MILGFKKQFITPIQLGAKIHTIRADKKNRWKPGKIIHMASGIRTKHYNCFKITECISTQEIIIKYHGLQWIVYVDGIQLSVGDLKKLATFDGFSTIADFAAWFNEDFTGKIIHWTKFKY